MTDTWHNLRRQNHKIQHQRLVIVGDASIVIVVGIRSTIVANDITLTAVVIIVAVWPRKGCVKASPCPLARRCCIVAAAAVIAAIAIATINIHHKSAIIRIAPLAWMGTLMANASVGHTLRH